MDGIRLEFVCSILTVFRTLIVGVLIVVESEVLNEESVPCLVESLGQSAVSGWINYDCEQFFILIHIPVSLLDRLVHRDVRLCSFRCILSCHICRNTPRLRWSLARLSADGEDAGDVACRIGRSQRLIDEGRSVADSDDLEVSGTCPVEHWLECLKVLDIVILHADRIDYKHACVICLEHIPHVELFHKGLSGIFVKLYIRIDEEGWSMIVRTALDLSRIKVVLEINYILRHRRHLECSLCECCGCNEDCSDGGGQLFHNLQIFA